MDHRGRCAVGGGRGHCYIAPELGIGLRMLMWARVVNGCGVCVNVSENAMDVWALVCALVCGEQCINPFEQCRLLTALHWN